MICDKITYDTHRDAKDAATRLAAKQGKGMKMYKCSDCGGFHVFTINPRKNSMSKNVNQKYKPDYTKFKPEKIKVAKHKPSKDSRKVVAITTYKPFAYLKQQ